MKIKEVCKQTGLTEKAVRYYVENGLVTPQEYTSRGRTYREYDESDIRTLRSVSTLRGIGMSIEKIRRIEKGNAPEVMQEYLKDLGSELERKQKLLRALGQQDYSSAEDAEQLAELIERSTRAEPAPPDFSRFDDLAAYADDLNAFERRSYERDQQLRRGARLGFLVTAGLLFGSVLALTSIVGIVLFLAAALAAIGLGSDYIGFYRILSVLGIVSNGISFFRTLNGLENKNLFGQLFSGGSMEAAAMPCLLYIIAAAVLIVCLILLLTNRALIEYLGDRR